MGRFSSKSARPLAVIAMPVSPNYENEYIQIKVLGDTHKLLRKTAREQFGSEQVPWSVVLTEALKEYERTEDSINYIN
jgi:hypothetical protein